VRTVSIPPRGLDHHIVAGIDHVGIVAGAATSRSSPAPPLSVSLPLPPVMVLASRSHTGEVGAAGVGQVLDLVAQQVAGQAGLHQVDTAAGRFDDVSPRLSTTKVSLPAPPFRVSAPSPPLRHRCRPRH
jgi:hypothetical protein